MSEKTISLTNLARYKQDSDNLYAKQNGSYENMSVGNADNLTPYGANSGSNDTTPFVFQSSGGGSDIGSLAQLKELRGNTIKFNQLAKAITQSNYSLGNATATFTDGVATVLATAQYGCIITDVKTVVGHKYLFRAKIKKSVATSQIRLGFYDSYVRLIASAEETTDWQYLAGFRTVEVAHQYNTIQVLDYGTDNFSSFEVSEINCFDLTDMFGAGNEPESVVEFNRLFQKSYYVYDSGSLLSCKSSGYKVVGYNAFDGEWENGFIGTSTGQNQGTSATSSRTKNYIRVIQGQTYKIETSFTISGDTLQPRSYFYDIDKNFIKVGSFTSNYELSIPNNCCYVRFAFGSYSVSSTDTLCLHLKWDDSKTGYEPYKSQTYQLPNVELRSARVSYDSITPDGTLTRKIGMFDLGTLTTSDIVLTAQTSDYLIVTIMPIYNDNSKKMKNLGGAILSDLKVNKTYKVSSPDAMYNKLGGSVSMAIAGPNAIYLRNDDVFTLGSATKEDVISALSGIVMQYGLLNEQESQVSTFVENTSIDDWGTQEFVSNESIVVPQGCDFFYSVDYKAFIDSLGEREDIDYDASELVSQTELQTAMSGIDLSDYVDLTTDQDIESTKTIKFGQKLRFENQYDGYIEINTSYYLLALSNGITAKGEIQGYAITPYNGEGSQRNIGALANRWYNLYLRGVISDGTNSVTVAQISNGLFGGYATNSTTQLEYETINNISLSANTTFTLATAPTNCYPEYKAYITNTGSSTITITLPSGTSIKGNVTISSNTFEITAGSSVELNISNSKAIVIEW